MRSFSYEIVYIICLPIQVLNFGLKFEGIIDLGPKWDYVYKVSPINQDIFSSYEMTLNDYHKNNFGKEDKKEISDTDDLATKSEEPSIEIPFINKGSLRDVLSLELQHDTINEEVIIEPKASKLLKSKTKKVKRNKNHRKTTKQFDLQNTYMFINNLNNDSEENVEVEIRNKMDKNFKTKNENFDSNTEKKLKKHKNVSEHIRNKTKSPLRNKNIDKQKLKNNAKIKDFIIHIFKQSLKIFDKMKKLTDEEKVKRKIKLLKNSYIEKFGDFLKETEDHKLKTKLANQNVILNTIDTSHYILKRLVNYLSSKIHEGYNMQRNSGLVKLFQREVVIGKAIEDKHACKKFAICRTNNEFSDFLIDILDIILQTNNKKITQASNSITEIVKTNDLTNIIDYETQNKLRKLMTKIESWDPFLIRSMFLILRNVIVNKNRPITIMEKADINLANRTVSFHNFIDILNKNMGTVENKSKWPVIKKDLEDWRDGRRNDVQIVLECIIRQIINVMENLDYEQRKDVSDLMKIMINSKI